MEGSLLVSDSEVQAYIQDSHGELWDLMIEYSPADHFVRTAYAITTTAGSLTYEILEAVAGSDALVYKITQVAIVDSGTASLLRPRANANNLGSVDSSKRGKPTEYSTSGPDFKASGGSSVVERRTLQLYPVPDGTYTVYVSYIPSPPDLTTNTDVNFYSFSGWDEYIVCDAAAKCLEKEESFEAANRLLARKLAAGDRIRYHLTTLHGGSSQVTDVDFDAFDDWRMP
jgi:hypothetical protein